MRTQLWDELLTSPPLDCCCILLDDFNFVKRRQDKRSACGRLVPMAKRMVFEALKTFLQVEELARLVDSSKFSWDNYRMDGLRILARVDRFYERFYVFRNLATATRRIISYRIKKDAGYSDHLLVELAV